MVAPMSINLYASYLAADLCSKLAPIFKVKSIDRKK
jgi:hypothetical protein